MRSDAGATVDVPALDLGPAKLILLPSESYVDYQFLAQKLQPEAIEMAVDYGECATGDVPTEKAIAESDTNRNNRYRVAPGCEGR